jgi:phosphotransferase system enzyme I (PtsI)
MTEAARGIGVSPGAAVGPVVQVRPHVRPPENEPAPADPTAEHDRVKGVFESVAQTLDERAAAADETAQQILTATALIARDKGLHKAVGRYLAAGKGPATAVTAAVGDFVVQFEALGGYFAERVTDLKDVRNRAVARILGHEDPGVPEFHIPSVIVATDLAPAETATLDPTLVRAIVTEQGGRTSHTAILAAQMGIPAVVQFKGARDIPSGTIVAVDGDTGEVTVDPSEDYQRTLVGKREKRRAALAGSAGPGRTRDGHPVALLANIGGVDDAVTAAAHDVEGVGLFRTEFVFLSRDTAPTLAEQTEIYTKVFEPFGTRRVTVRTLDAGADKPLAFADLGPEENPALGKRGLRLQALRPELLEHQLAALAAAAAATAAEVKVMAPMVATPEEAAWFARRVREHGLRSVGVMIEVPGAAILAKHVLSEVDFGSLGTNDLAQYTMAADRMEGQLSDLLDPWQPAVLQVIGHACDGARLAGKPIGVCGEAGGDPLLALVLAGLGVTSLSMAPSKVAIVRHALALHTLAQCHGMATAALEQRSAADAAAAVSALADPSLVDLL